MPNLPDGWWAVEDDWVPWIPGQKGKKDIPSYRNIPDAMTAINKLGNRYVLPGVMLTPIGPKERITIIAIVKHDYTLVPRIDDVGRCRIQVYIIQAASKPIANPVTMHTSFDPPNNGELGVRPWAIRISQQPGKVVRTQRIT